MDQDHKKTVIVFGGTGLVGQHLLMELLALPDISKIISVGRRPADGISQKLEHVLVSDFEKFNFDSSLPAADVVFCCIGTTIRKAGSQSAFKKIDLDIPVQIARFASHKKIPTLIVISSLGANENSGNFYLRTKGEMEQSVGNIYKGQLKFLRPSILIGNRKEMRWGEFIGIQCIRLFGWLLVGPFKKYRGISAAKVAKAMIRLSEDSTDKRIYESHEL